MAFESSPVPTFVARLSDTRLLAINEALENLLGYKKNELLGLTLSNLTIWNSREDLDQLLHALANDSSVVNLELGIHRKDRELLTIRCSAKRAEFNGEPCIVSTLLDNTDQKHIEDALRSSEEKVRWILENSMDALYRRNFRTNTYDYFSPSITKIAGYTPEELMPMSNRAVLNTFVIPEDHEVIESQLQEVQARGGGPTYLVYRIRHKNGSIRWLGDMATLSLDSEGNPLYSVGSVRDITEARQTQRELLIAKEAAESASRIKSEFIDIAAHELCTPLTPMMLLIDGALRRIAEGNPIPSTFFDHLKRQVLRLTGLVNDLLNVSRLERGEFDLHLTRTDLTPLIRECVEEFRSLDPKRPMILTGDKEPFLAQVDPTRIHQLLANLLDNALKYTPSHSPIEITMAKQAGRIRISVIDHGPGVAEDQQARLFTRFYRVPTDVTLRHAGLGLGLYACRRIAELHGGTVEIQSTAGKGSIFTFELPGAFQGKM